MKKIILKTSRQNITDIITGEASSRQAIRKIPAYSESTQILWSLLHHTNDLISKCEEAEFNNKVGISYQHFVILMMMEALSSPIREIDLARQLERSTNTMSTTLDCMERHGLIKKVRAVADRRAIHIISTNKGRTRLKKATLIGWAMIQRLLASLSQDEIEVLINLLAKVNDNTDRELGRRNDRKAKLQPDYRKIVELVDNR